MLRFLTCLCVVLAVGWVVPRASWAVPLGPMDYDCPEDNANSGDDDEPHVELQPVAAASTQPVRPDNYSSSTSEITEYVALVDYSFFSLTRISDFLGRLARLPSRVRGDLR